MCVGKRGSGGDWGREVQISASVLSFRGWGVEFECVCVGALGVSADTKFWEFRVGGVLSVGLDRSAEVPLSVFGESFGEKCANSFGLSVACLPSQSLGMFRGSVPP